MTAASTAASPAAPVPSSRERIVPIAPFLLLLPALVASATFFVAPVVYLVIQSFHEFSMMTGVGGFSFQNYEKLLFDGFYLGILGQTFELAALSSVICLVLGYPLAYYLRLAPPRIKGLLIVFIISPLLVSVVVRTFGWVVVLGEFGLVNNLLLGLGIDVDFTRQTHLFTKTAVLIGLSHVYFPFMILSLYSSLQKLDFRIVRAARNLGASPARAFWEVTLPLSLPGIVAGVTTVFALTTGAYVTVAVLGGARVLVMAVLAYQQAIGLVNWQFGAAIGVTLLVTTTILLRLFQAVVRRVNPGVMLT